MTKTFTKSFIAAALIVAGGFASSAFASDASETMHDQPGQYVAQRLAPAHQAYARQDAVNGAYASDAYAYAPYGVSAAEQREFNRVDSEAMSSR